ncbi:hypothetical protein ABEB36_013558 [Hypothenemus hampei]|uniref:BZIP domain-containing protein n=1 Tax=Hypothenemus hampei TaxID=57062 RepID=A0ABD1E5I5_HYPHA
MEGIPFRLKLKSNSVPSSNCNKQSCNRVKRLERRSAEKNRAVYLAEIFDSVNTEIDERDELIKAMELKIRVLEEENNKLKLKESLLDHFFSPAQ